MIDLSDFPVSALLELHSDLLAELRRRNVVRSSNNPTGDYGELLFSRAFSWTLNGNSSADADAVDANGMRYQIKCRKLETAAGSRQLGFIRRLPEKPFDHLAAVLLDGKYRVLRGAIIPYEVVEPSSLRGQRQGVEVRTARFCLGSGERNRRDGKVAGSGSCHLMVKPAYRTESRLERAMADHALQTVSTEKL